MSFEIIFGIVVILLIAIWAAIYIQRRTKENNNQHLFDFIPHLFPTLGILFTFIGIAIGLWNFDSNDIEKSIPELINGLKTAFLVSIFGVALLVGFSFWTNIKRKKLEEGILSDETQALINLIEVIKELRNDLTSVDENGNQVKVGNVLRDIYRESAKQSNSLQSFSADLALSISAGFEEILNNPSQGVVAELKLVKAEIESLGNKLQDPATDMTQSIVKELQESMGKMIEEFKTSINGDTKNEMEQLAMLIGQAGGALTDFPQKLKDMTENLNDNFRGLQDVVNQISQQTLSQSEESTNAMKKQVEEMSEILKNKVGDLQQGQQSLLTEQSRNLAVSENLLNSFNNSVEKMNEMAIEAQGAISMFSKVQTELDSTASQLKSIGTNVNASSNYFKEAQVKFAQYSNIFLENNSLTIDEIQKSLIKAKDVSADYANKFEIIEKGLQGIFIKISDGLTEYQKTVGGSLETYLSKYSKALTDTASSLEKASGKQEDMLEQLTEQLDKLNARRN